MNLGELDTTILSAEALKNNLYNMIIHEKNMSYHLELNLMWNNTKDIHDYLCDVRENLNDGKDL